jgi:hypothetical protein
LFVLLSHSGIAILFAIKKPSLQCSSPGEFYALSSLKQTNVIQTVVDQEALCGLIILFIIITSWFTPALGVYDFDIFGIFLMLMTQYRFKQLYSIFVALSILSTGDPQYHQKAPAMSKSKVL